MINTIILDKIIEIPFSIFYLHAFNLRTNQFTTRLESRKSLIFGFKRRYTMLVTFNKTQNQIEMNSELDELYWKNYYLGSYSELRYLSINKLLIYLINNWTYIKFFSKIPKS